MTTEAQANNIEDPLRLERGAPMSESLTEMDRLRAEHHIYADLARTLTATLATLPPGPLREALETLLERAVRQE